MDDSLTVHMDGIDGGDGVGGGDVSFVLPRHLHRLPDHATDYVHTFDEPGTYQVVCLEFCGVGHHRMLGTIRVEEP